jgi:hypothetical protein
MQSWILMSGLAAKRRETYEAHGQTDRLLALESEKDQSHRVPLQPGDQTRPNIGIEWFGAPHGVLRVGVDHCKHGLAMFG